MLFANIKHLFLQPCDKELLVIVHINLKAPIMIGKKQAHVSGSHYLVHASSSFTATQDIQFFLEASDVQFDETGNRQRKHRYGDEDEIEMDNKNGRRQMLNKLFGLFVERLAEAVSTSVRWSDLLLTGP